MNAFWLRRLTLLVCIVIYVVKNCHKTVWKFPHFPLSKKNSFRRYAKIRYSKTSTDEILSKCIFVQFRVVYNCIGSWELGTFVCSTRMGQNDKMLHFQLPEKPSLASFLHWTLARFDEILQLGKVHIFILRRPQNFSKSTVHTVKSKGKISRNFAAFS